MCHLFWPKEVNDEQLMLVRVPIGEDIHNIGDADIHLSLDTKEVIIAFKRARKIEIQNDVPASSSPVSASNSLEDIDPFPGQTLY